MRTIKNILLISSIYPAPTGNKGTAVCHFFAREWEKMGYHVQAVSIQAVYPFFFYWIARFFFSRIAAVTGAIVYTKPLRKTESYSRDGVNIVRIPVMKPVPHGRFLSRSVSRAVSCIVKSCSKNQFVPDVIIGHFPNPQIEILSLLKKVYPQAKNCIVMHGDIDLMQKVYGHRLPGLMSNIDMWGFRSKTIEEDFTAAVGKVDNPFICYSGVPEDFITQNNTHDFSAAPHRFLFVGGMIERKYPEKVLDALCQAYPDGGFSLSYVGDGKQKDVICKKVEEQGLQDQVHILGRIPRNQTIEEYDKADCMVMISRGEAFGLVYLEAMARGCITIASRREGMDGIIVDGENGFLCEAGNAEELAEIIQHIHALSPEELREISNRAIMTASNLTDSRAAERYINDIKNRI